MNFMICMGGDPEQHEHIPNIEALGAGVELQSYGLVGIRAQKEWEKRFEYHKRFTGQFHGPLSVHGPFIGMQFDHPDHLIHEAIERRMDMTFEMVRELKAGTLVLHTGYSTEQDQFEPESRWVDRNVEYWKGEIGRWEELGVRVVLENLVERTPDLMIRLIDRVNSRALGLCMDVGHVNVFSAMPPLEWVEDMGSRLWYVHVHDNDGKADQHLAVGRGTIAFPDFFDALKRVVPDVTVSLEAFVEMKDKVAGLREIVETYK